MERGGRDRNGGQGGARVAFDFDAPPLSLSPARTARQCSRARASCASWLWTGCRSKRNEEEAVGGTGARRNEPERRRRGSARAIDWSSTHGIKSQTAGDGPLVAGPILWHAPMGGECHKIGAATKRQAKPTHGVIPCGGSYAISGDMVSWSEVGRGWSRLEWGGSSENHEKARPDEGQTVFFCF